MANKLPKAGLQVLAGYFSEFIADHCSRSGCNDMPQELFWALTPQDKSELHDDFLEWDKVANPDDWEPKGIDWITDTSWGAYLMSRLEDCLNAEIHKEEEREALHER